jgi:hypothetical protein
MSKSPVFYRIPIIRQMTPLHTLKLFLFKFHFNTVLSFGPISSKRSPSFRFTHQNNAIISLSHPCLLLLHPTSSCSNNYTTVTFVFCTTEFSFPVLNLRCLQLHVMGILWNYYASQMQDNMYKYEYEYQYEYECSWPRLSTQNMQYMVTLNCIITGSNMYRENVKCAKQNSPPKNWAYT